MNEEQIKYLTNRFLMWKLPADFNPDCGISFKAEHSQNSQYPGRYEPVGTNLFSATQAEEMIRYLVTNLPLSKGD